MAEAIREGLVATIGRRPEEAAWYDGGLTIRPQSAPTPRRAQEKRRWEGRRPGGEVGAGAWWQALNDPRALWQSVRRPR